MIYSDKENERIIDRHIENGVIIADRSGLIIDDTAVIEPGAVIHGGNRIIGDSYIGADAEILSGNIIENARIGAFCRIERSIIRDSAIGSHTTVIMAHVHTNSLIGRDTRIGNFVEIKNSRLGKANKIAHLAYVGDVDMGDYCNIGCGVIFVNYDGRNKHRSVVGDSVFIGSNSNIIAPLRLENRAYIAAGTTVTKDLPRECMCIGRSRETIKMNRSSYGIVKNQLFGTDGIRGVYGRDVDEHLAYMCGNFLGYSSDGGVIAVGRDSRISGESLEEALINGITDAGANAVDLGIVTTPITAFAVKRLDANYGVMLTASHNPKDYNGIKIFNIDGYKLSELEEAEIERHILGEKPIVRSVKGRCELGDSIVRDYIDTITRGVNLEGIKVAVDGANGGAGRVVKEALKLAGAVGVYINCEMDGARINENCGATNTAQLQSTVIKNSCDIGIALDGDADRLIAVDREGNIVDGDQILYILAKAMSDSGKMKVKKIACTVLSNAGLKHALAKIGVEETVTDVGDHNVAEAMRREGILIGGEQSGHIILGEYLPTGDGVNAAIRLMSIMKESSSELSALADVIKYPQVSKNIRVGNKAVVSDEILSEQVRHINEYYGDNARVLVRASGTEPLIRVMAEAVSEELALQLVHQIADTVIELNERDKSKENA